jgi:hypothetical protein
MTDVQMAWLSLMISREESSARLKAKMEETRMRVFRRGWRRIVHG